MTVDLVTAPPPRGATLADWLALPEGSRAEFIHGRIVHHAMPGSQHGVIRGIDLP